VENIFRRKLSGAGDYRAAGRTTAGTSANLIELAHDGGPASAMYRSIHAAAARQCGVGCIDNGVGGNASDVAFAQG
jgi:hypothetical protein